MAPPKTKRPKRKDSPDLDDDDDEERLPYFVPEEGIDIEPLALYARGILDREARVKTGVHPQRPEQKGFWIMSGNCSHTYIAAMIDDTRLWRREEKKGYYLDSDTAKRRLKIGRAAAAKERPMAQARSKRETEDARNMPQPVSRASADNITLASAAYRQDSTATSIPRPASAQPIPPDNRRAPSQPYPAVPGYNAPTPSSPQYTMAMSPTQYSSSSAYDQDAGPPPPYDLKRGGGSGHPTTTGTQGFQSLYATAGGPPPPGPPQQRRHGSG